MITPRRTRLLRVPGLDAFQRAIAEVACPPDLDWCRSCAVIVPTESAAAELRTTLENLLLLSDPSETHAPGERHGAIAFPDLVTREGWYRHMHERLPAAPPLLSPLEREVLAQAAARDAIEGGLAPPFRLRPGLVGAVLEFYDDLHRHRRTVEAFERLLVSDLEPNAGIDRGAARLLQQTRFLVAAFRAYERRRDESGSVDETSLRNLLLHAGSGASYAHAVVTVGDRASDVAGLFAADFDLLTRLPGLETVDILATEDSLAAGFGERLREMLPGIEEIVWQEAAPAQARSSPTFFVSRDREEELCEVARSLKANRRAGGTQTELDRTAVVFRRPLPYVYLAATVFDAAGIPFQAADALPLAAEPFAAAIDLIFSFVASGFSRAATAVLLASPHFAFDADGPVDRVAVSSFDRALAEAGYLGDREELARIAAELNGPAARAAEAASRAADALAPLAEAGRASDHVNTLLDFLARHERRRSPEDVAWERHQRARSAILAALADLRAAHAAHDDPAGDFETTAATIRRWMETQTFSPRRGSGGVHLVDAQAARYGDYDDVFVVGLVEPDWPGGRLPNIFYPASLLNQLGWPAEKARLAGTRAGFLDLVGLAHRRLTLSAFTLEDDALVERSSFLEDVVDVTAPATPAGDPGRTRIFLEEALVVDPVRDDAVPPPAQSWLAQRRARTATSDHRYHGAAGAYTPEVYSVSAVDLYLDCPFKFFATWVLRLEEEPEDEEGLTARARGEFVHDVLRDFYEAWDATGAGAVTPANLDEARRLFSEIASRALGSLTPADAAPESLRLLGSPVVRGAGDVVLAAEAESSLTVTGRLLEQPLDGWFDIAGREGTRRLRLHGRADRIDLVGEGSFRVVDYKTGRAPQWRRSVQLPIYAVCASQWLAATRGGQWRVAEAAYLALAGTDNVRTIVPDSKGTDEALAAGQQRLLDAVDGMGRGEFPPRPAETHLCSYCQFAAVCRKDYVVDE